MRGSGVGHRRFSRATEALWLAPRHPDVQFIELDHRVTSAARAKGIALESQPTNMIQIAADLGERPPSEVLAEHGRWDTAMPSVLVAEGLLQYLTDEEVRGLLKEAAPNVMRSLSGAEGSVANPTESRDGQHAAQRGLAPDRSFPVQLTWVPVWRHTGSTSAESVSAVVGR